MATLFATRGVKSTIITTPLNATLLCDRIQRRKYAGIPIDIKILKFPCAVVGLLEGTEDAHALTSPEESMKFFKALTMLQEPLKQLLQESKPDCLVADMLYPWATASAGKFGIPTLVFCVFSIFSLCITMCLEMYKPHRNIESDSETFVVPNFPDNIKLTRKQMGSKRYSELVMASRESAMNSYGILVNSFYELEGTYADHYWNEFGVKMWHIGPFFLYNRGIEDKAHREKEASIDEHECLKWLDSKEPNSVVYICFGTLTQFNCAQLKEIAMGLEASGQQFIWVVRKHSREEQDWLPKGFEQRMEGKGLIIKEWAPQLLILEHQATGGFVTHCGWNSTIEGVCGGVPMVTWPIMADQFYNEKLVTEVLKIGIPVGVSKSVAMVGDFVQKEAIEKAVKEIIEGEKVEEMWSRAKELREMERKTTEKAVRHTLI
ncbi:hypothetical protein SLEP1_g14155 [Rubroshorea leprosula]|uniref:Glycosyltransferase n=1 Tax=Rubroshorea leprosula TaxID=152421 RepID=A0AAV5ISR1_9ROSI|nr:hypothetical protein SLEP1_g14155 [Rubroshorea leprosula]